jgi:hypothetical protein
MRWGRGRIRPQLIMHCSKAVHCRGAGVVELEVPLLLRFSEPRFDDPSARAPVEEGSPTKTRSCRGSWGWLVEASPARLEGPAPSSLLLKVAMLSEV